MQAIRVISLARRVDRRLQFMQRNPHLKISFFDAVDGDALTQAYIDATGAFTPQVAQTYNAHRYGCALSHWRLWKEAAAGSEPLTIAEDDAVFRRDFAERSADVLASLKPGWDMVLWGWNFDTVLQMHLPGSVSSAAMLFDEGRLQKSLDRFQAEHAPVQAFKVEKAFGLLAYTLSPGGAEKFLGLCFPQKPLAVYIPVLNYHMANIGVDASTNAVYGQTDSFVCFPPLAVSPNADGQIDS